MQLLRFGFVLSCLIPALALAQSPFDGTWRVVPGSDQLPTKPDVYLLQGGTYHCPTCKAARIIARPAIPRSRLRLMARATRSARRAMTASASRWWTVGLPRKPTRETERP